MRARPSFMTERSIQRKQSVAGRPLHQSLLDCGLEEKDQENNIQGDINDRTKVKLATRHRKNDPDNSKQEQDDGTDQPSNARPPSTLPETPRSNQAHEGEHQDDHNHPDAPTNPIEVPRSDLY